jgi:hypothetical protein
MPADNKVSVGWQIAALFVPIANFWAFYRIRKLRKYSAYVYLPSVAVMIAVFAYYYSSLGYEKPFDDGSAFGASPYDFVLFNTTLFAIGSAINWCLFGLSIYLIVKWSRLHNRQFDTQPATT